jgi:hypothetical protein
MTDDLNLHYTTVINAITDGRVVFFLGAGANLCGRPQDKTWQPGQNENLPSGSELAEYLAEKFAYPPDIRRVDCHFCQSNIEVSIRPQDLARVSQFVDVMNGEGPLYMKLHNIFNHNYPPTDVHKFLVNLPAVLRKKGYNSCNQLIVTTNYDKVLEQTFLDADEPFDLVFYEAKGKYRGKFLHHTYLPPNKEASAIIPIENPKEYLALSLDQRTIILKIHGTVTNNFVQDSYVITEDHFIEYLTHTEISDLLPITLKAKLSNSHVLFLGYGLRDWNLRVILYRLWQQRELSFQSWAIQLEPDVIDQKFWARYDVEFKEIPLHHYVAMLNAKL